MNESELAVEILGQRDELDRLHDLLHALWIARKKDAPDIDVPTAREIYGVLVRTGKEEPILVGPPYRCPFCHRTEPRKKLMLQHIEDAHGRT